MAGILAPTISDIGAAPGGVGVSVDTSVGDLFSNIGGIISTGVRSTPTATSITQQDRDNAAIAPNIEEAKRIEALRASGAIGANQLDAMIRTNMVSAVSRVPSDSAGTIAALSAIHGRDINVFEPNLEEGRTALVAKFFLEDPRGIAMYPQTVVLKPGTDEQDIAASNLRAEALFQKFANQDMDDAVLADNLERARLEGDLGKEKQRELVDPFIKENVAAAVATVQGLGSIFDMTSQATGADISEMVVGAVAAKERFMIGFAQRAANLGLSDNEAILDATAISDVFDGPIRLLERLQLQPEVLRNMQRNNAAFRLGQFLTSAGILADDFAIEYSSAIALDARREDIVAGLPKFLANTPQNGLGTDTPALPEAVGTPSVIDPEFSEQAAALPEFKQVEEVQHNLEGFYLSDGYGGTDPAVREGSVEFFTRAVGVMQSTGKDITQGTFDQTYRPEFIEMFGEITSIDDDVSTKFKDVVAEHLSTVLSQQNVNKNFLISNNFSDYKELRIKFNGDTFALDLGTGKGQGLGRDSKDVVLKNLLKKHGLPATMEGLTSLIAIPPSQIGVGVVDPQEITAIGDARRMVRLLKPQMGYLNKVLGVGEAISQSIFSGIPDFAEEDEIIHVTNAEEFVNVPIGGSFSYVDDGGNLIVSRFGGDG